MKIVLMMIILAVEIFWCFSVFAGNGKPVEDYSACRSCHENIGAMDEDHDFSCFTCHLMPKNRIKPVQDHALIVGRPASPENAVLFCGGCHDQEIRQLQGSRHWTLGNMIAQTRFLWGAQEDPTPRYGAAANDRLEKMPESPVNIQTPADLVDDLLRRRCFSCHICAVPPRARGMMRSTGCAACHVLYGNDGSSQRRKPVQRKKTGQRKKAEAGSRGAASGAHPFCRPIPVRQCMHCHNGPHIGGAYGGMCRHDFHGAYRTPLKHGYLPEEIYMMDHHQLSRDIHFEAGLLCVDCHGRSEVMGSSRAVGGENQGTDVRCMGCHGNGNGDGKCRPQTSFGGGDGEEGGRARHGLFISATGVAHHVPLWNPGNPAHTIPGMEKVHCLGCHAAWGDNAFGASFIRDDRKNLSRWALWRMQADGAVRALFDHRGGFLGKPDQDGPGPWLLGWRFRRWEYLVLGKDEQGRIISFRPQYQYRISHVAKDGRVVLDSVIPERGDGTGPGWAFMPYYPHTVRPRGRSCEACHGSSLAAGLGLWDGAGPDLALTRPSPPVYSSMGLLDQTEVQHLLVKTPIYRKWRFKVMWGDYHTK